MRVVHYINDLDRQSGGTTAYMELLSRELGKLVELHVVAHASENPLDLPGAQVHLISSSLLGGMKREWLGKLAELQPDVVHVNGCWLPGCALSQLWAQKAGFKVVLSPHGMLEPWILRRHYLTRKLPALWLYQRRAVRQADALHATAASEGEHLRGFHGRGPIFVIANGIDVEHIAMKTSWKRRREILFLSRLHEKKGLPFLFEAASHLKDRLDGYTIRIAGEGEAAYVEELNGLAQRLGVEKMIRFEGGVYGPRKWELIRAADLFVLPTFSENFGIVVAEALAAGTPVLTTKGAPWEELESRGCGFWTDVGTEGTLEALRVFLSLSDSFLEQMGRRGRRLVEEKYSANKMAADMLEMYKSLDQK